MDPPGTLCLVLPLSHDHCSLTPHQSPQHQSLPTIQPPSSVRSCAPSLLLSQANSRHPVSLPTTQPQSARPTAPSLLLSQPNSRHPASIPTTQPPSSARSNAPSLILSQANSRHSVSLPTTQPQPQPRLHTFIVPHSNQAPGKSIQVSDVYRISTLYS